MALWILNMGFAASPAGVDAPKPQLLKRGFIANVGKMMG